MSEITTSCHSKQSSALQLVVKTGENSSNSVPSQHSEQKRKQQQHTFVCCYCFHFLATVQPPFRFVKDASSCESTRYCKLSDCVIHLRLNPVNIPQAPTILELPNWQLIQQSETFSFVFLPLSDVEHAAIQVEVNK